MAFTRTGVRDKLNLLLLAPLLAIALLALPFVASRVDDARTASLTASAATNARHVAGLLYALQRERLSAVNHLATATDNQQSPLARQQVAVDDAVADLRGSVAPGSSRQLVEALDELAKLKRTRALVAGRKAGLRQVYDDYRRATDTLLRALGLDGPAGASTGASRQMQTLDALLRVTEQNSRIGATLVVAAVDPAAGRELLVEASALQGLHRDRFMRVARAGQVEMMRLLDEGESTGLLRGLAERVPVAKHGLGARFAAEARGIAESQAVLWHLLVVRTVRDVEGAATTRAGGARVAAWAVSAGTLLIFALAVALGVSVSRSIARPLRQLTRAARAVAELASTELARVSDEERVDDLPPRLAAIAVRSRDEVGDLAAAFNRVQGTAALLLERQVLTRGNVGLMFASVARRTQNLVGRQLQMIDQMERDEQDAKLLGELYRLDHLSMRLRRSAENLLVISGAPDEARIAGPARLATVLRSALAEIEDFQRVRLVSFFDVTVGPDLVPDLSQLLAELLENATTYSPPGTVVDVSAKQTGEGCQIVIVDHGIGMPAEQMAGENRRFVQRERLDIAPTTVLGLFVVGRLARRHGLTVALEPTPGGGVTAVIGVPGWHLMTSDLPATPVPNHHGRHVDAGMPPALVPAAPSQVRDHAGFGWFANDESTTRPSPVAVSASPPPRRPSPRPSPSPTPRPVTPAGDPAAAPTTRNGLTRRVPGANLGAVARSKRPVGGQQRTTPASAPFRDPERERAAMDAFATAVTRAAAETASVQRTSRATLDEEGTTR
ncbi:MAG: sensor histidine kinase [Actinophytocola sp.]|uniref:sensor histidine kinase n=1 Tax=Actinophytocola sp. TaxID=1872138 RepID=UPI003D6BA694